MSLPHNLQESLTRLHELEKQIQSQQPRKPSWFASLKWKSDNLFLLVLITTLVCMSCLLVLFVQEQSASEQIRSRQQREQAPQGPSRNLEIPLGDFETMARSSATPSNLTVLQYDAYLTTNGHSQQLLDVENIVHNRKHRLRSTVEAVMSNASREDLKQPSLAKLRTKLVEQLNEVIGHQFIKDVQFANFLQFQLPSED